MWGGGNDGQHVERWIEACIHNIADIGWEGIKNLNGGKRKRIYVRKFVMCAVYDKVLRKLYFWFLIVL